MTRKKWQALLAFWIRELELGDQKITLKFVKAKEIPGCNAEASFVDPEATEWVIKIRTTGGPIENPEVTLVHELLHISFCILDARYERPLWRTAREFVRLRYAETPCH